MYTVQCLPDTTDDVIPKDSLTINSINLLTIQHVLFCPLAPYFLGLQTFSFSSSLIRFGIFQTLTVQKYFIMRLRMCV